MVTLKTIAERAGVSVGTVSIALGLNRAGQRLRASTLARVLEAAAELGYRRNAYAQGLVTGQTSVLGFVSWNFSEWHNTQLFEGIGDAAGQRGYLVKSFRYDRTDDTKVVGSLLEQRVAGAVAVGPTAACAGLLAREFARFRFPFVFVSGEPLSDFGPVLFTDDRQGCFLLVDHLRRQGRRQFALVGTRTDPGTFHRRREDFRSTLNDCGIALPSQRIIDCLTHDPVDATQAVQRLLSQDVSSRPDAVCCTSDAYAAIVLRVARHLGLRVPQDVAVTGFGDAPFACLCDPALTTVRQPFQQLGELVVDRLLNASAGESATAEPHLIPVELRIRGSA